MKLKGKQQSDRLTTQQKASDGVIGIFDTDAQNHDKEVHNTSLFTMQRLKEEFPKLAFRYRSELSKQEINEVLQKIDKRLGQTLFVSNARIKPDGGIIEVKDDSGNWRIVVVSEAKYQGKDIENIKNGRLVGKIMIKCLWLQGMLSNVLTRIFVKLQISCLSSHIFRIFFSLKVQIS